MRAHRVLASLLLGLGLASCAAVLGLHDRRGLRAFEHRAHVLQGIGCWKCHEGIERTGERGLLHLPTAEVCLSCHPKPHDPAPCLGCHAEIGNARRALEAKAHLIFEHAPHLEVTKGNCVRCHLEIGEDRTDTPQMATCLSCHPHQDQYDVRACDRCHVDLPTEALRPRDHAAHDLDFTKRHGLFAASQRDYCDTCHSERSCASCHGVNLPVLEARRAFDRVELGASPLHRAGFRSRHAEEARADPGTCATCHAPTTCQSCHAREGLGATGRATRGPHPPDWVGATRAENRHGRAARLDPLACASCHGGSGEQLCVSCHKVGGIGGNIHPPGWSSTKTLRQAPCVLCHGAGP